MVRRAFVLLFVALAARDAYALPPVRTMYTQALAREQAIRPALLADNPDPAALPEVRAVVADYEALVRRYPASGYSDNALWQAGRLSLDAFEVFGDDPDRQTGRRLLKRLAATYPTSSLAKRVPDELARADKDAPAGGNTVADRQTAAPAVVAPAAAPAAAAALSTIQSITREVLPDAVRVTIALDAEVPFHDERIPDPPRVFIDLSGTRATAELRDRTIRFEGDGDFVRQIRLGRHPNHTTRVVLDMAGVSSYSVYPLYNPYRLVIDCVRRPVGTTLVRQPRRSPILARRLAPGWLPTPPAGSPGDASVVAEAIAAAVKAPDIADNGPVAPLATGRAPARNLDGEFSISRQLGLGISRIVIDAGHGGHDPGAKGKGITEAELVLDVALRLEKLLNKVPGVEVILTRRTDDFVPLQERTAIANREGADLFLSIHANASTSASARGVETYFLNFANNLSSAAVAARENAASGQTMGALPDIVKAIALNNKLAESRDFATQVQRAMIDRLRPANRTVKDLGVRQAPFVVLIGAAMPSVLAEISFITNPQEEHLLKTGAYRQRIADALFNAIRKYQLSLNRTPAVAHTTNQSRE